ncbi:MerR family transcriptional regulator [Nocardia cyriacigeorgica]|uniref:MerR family transcriptional regulator n=1 Tax=Nocardia cyriacigeorgica TaxID=135487 RepID=A0A6P1D5X4_9NOCA|nr:MerR family transcriptional regulator [Nocardia cyriacigeorgica]NEW42333.1 MerR family transcriptional regulator [Nocardia cyriacigeorgica]NEW46036.1 MerR family transcriptional regulator [Nocardia cyriacigeorgica]NEW53229.1 MerR family transcriptional regulator [Nocardia cyriacigeorgica]NEW57792.1 MerR family transcriptional regulator [Nocardia cyriacigeorgica]
MPNYRIDDLARAAGTTTRNVRAYQERGLLPPPVGKNGRASIYDDTHLERLRLIDSLLQRGFTTAHIADFITSWETGKDLTEVLGLQHAVTATWAKEEPFEVSRELIGSILGPDTDELVEQLRRMGLVRIDNDTVVFTDTQLLTSFAELDEYGLDLRTLISVHTKVAAHIDDITKIMITAARKHIVDEHGPGWLPETSEEIAQTTAMLNKMRELSVASVHSTLARSLDTNLRRELGEYLETAADRERKRTAANSDESEGRR